MTKPAEHPIYRLRERTEAGVERCRVFRTPHGGSEYNTLDLAPPAVRVEVEDLAYHHDSPVTLPALPSRSRASAFEPVLWEDPDFARAMEKFQPMPYEMHKRARPFQVSPSSGLLPRHSMVLLAVTCRFLELNPPYRLLVAGHADTTGERQYNQRLSERRAENLLHLLRGEQDDWVRMAQEHGKVEDYQLILKHYARLFGWECDPGEIDNQSTAATGTAVRTFQQSYRDAFDSSLRVDGDVGGRTWGAFFSLYMRELAGFLETGPESLDSMRAHLRWVDERHPVVGCGEQMPIDQPERNEFFSDENRRVEILFFHESRLPSLDAHLPGGSIYQGRAGREASDIYDRPFTYLHPQLWSGEPPPLVYEPHFEILPVEQDTEELPEEARLTDEAIPLQGFDLDPEDPWSFLDAFAQFFPGVGGASEIRKVLENGGG